MIKAEHLRDEVIGLKPAYCELGNVTDVMLKTGGIVRDKRVINSVVRALAASYALDLKEQRKILRGNLSRKAMLPFYLGPGRIFVPLKMRQAIAEKDAVYGYVDLAFMGEPLDTDGRRCLVPLLNGLEVEVLSSPATVHGVKHSGRLAMAVFEYEKDNDENHQLLEAGRVFTSALIEIRQQLNRIEENLNDIGETDSVFVPEKKKVQGE